VVEGGAGAVVEGVVEHHAEVGWETEGIVDGFRCGRRGGFGEEVVELGDVGIVRAGETTQGRIDDGGGAGLGRRHGSSPG
jgi:hypothetical protein